MKTLAIGTAAVGAALLLAGCDERPASTGAPLPGAASATATLRTADGAEIGRATAVDVAGGLRVTLDTRGLPPGPHGLHIHAVGRCDPPDFASAAAHWNPTGAKHGSMNPQGPHEGDLPNLTVGSDGRGSVGATIPGASVAALLDTDGSALVVHAGRDDLMTDPSGNSGGRIACGVFAGG